MSFIDWSDSEGMFGLFLDFVADASAECPEDAERHRFLADLLARLRTVASELPEISTAVLIEKLRDIRESVDIDFAQDPVTVHLHDCLEELERVENRPQ